MKERKAQGPAVYEVQSNDQGHHYIMRNGRHLMTPAGHPYQMQSLQMAEDINAEWKAQGDKIVPATMPLTQLYATAIDIVAKDRAKTINALLAYIGTELLCQWAEHPENLIQKQRDVWQPYIDWCNARYDINFVVGHGIMPVSQNDEVTQRLGHVIESCDNLALAGLSTAVDTSGSLILGLALSEGFKTACEIFEAAELDFAHQAQTWGDDPVTRARQESVRKELEACERWFALLS